MPNRLGALVLNRIECFAQDERRLKAVSIIFTHVFTKISV